MAFNREHTIAINLMKKFRTFKWHDSDCWDMACAFYEQWNGIKLPRYAYNEKCITPPDEAYKDWEKIDLPQPGCLVAIQMEGHLHIGIALGEGNMLHMVNSSPPVRISKMNNFRRYITGFYRYKT